MVDREGCVKSGLGLGLCKACEGVGASYLKWDIESLIKSKQGSLTCLVRPE